MIRRRLASFACILGLLIAGLPAMVGAQGFPDKPITIVVPYPPGASTDQIARLIAPKLQASLGQTVIVENRSGADGTVGASYVARSAPDGYRVLIATQPIIAINPHLQKDNDFDPLTRLAPLTSAVSAVMAVAVNGALPVNNMSELIAYAKKNPGTLSFGSAGTGSPQHLGGLLIGERAQIDWVHVPYKGGAPMVNDLLAGHVQVGIATLSVFKPLMHDSRIRVIAVGDKVRYSGAPEIPTISETLPDFELTTWLGFYGPRGLPPAVASRLSNEIGKALNTDDVKSRLRDLALLVNADGPEPLDRIGRDDFASYGKIIADHHIQPD